MRKFSYLLSSFLLGHALCLGTAAASLPTSDSILEGKAKQVSLQSLPRDLIKVIGEQSGNTLALKTTCHAFNNLNFATKNTIILLRHSEGFQQGLQTRASGNPDFSQLGLWDDVRILNLYNLTAEDFAVLFPDANSVGISLMTLRGNPHTPIKRLILRTSRDSWDSYRPMPLDICTAIQQSGVELYFVGERESSKIDRFFSHTPLSEAMLLNLLKMTSFSWDVEKMFAEGSSHTMREGFCLEQYIRQDGGAHITNDPAYLQHVLKTHGEIVSTKKTQSLTHYSCRAMPYVWGLLNTERHANGVQVLETIRDIHLMELCYGTRLFETDESENLAFRHLPLISHDGTYHILQLLRGFIPPYAPEDYFYELDKPWHGFLKVEGHQFSRPYQSKKAIPSTRNDIFVDFVKAIASYPQNMQLIRLKKLMQVIAIVHLAQVDDADRTLRHPGYFETACRESLRFVHDSTDDMTTHEFSKFIAYLKEKHAEFNPLFINSEDQLKEILNSYNKTTTVLEKLDETAE